MNRSFSAKVAAIAIAIGCFECLAPGPSVGMAADGDQAETLKLLQTLRAARQATISAFPSGTGKALIAINNDGDRESDEVSFKFVGRDSLAEVKTLTGAKPLRDWRYLYTKDRWIKYLLPGEGPISSVSIDAPDRIRSVGFGFNGWSYSDFMEVPMGAPSEDALFDVLLNKGLPQESMTHAQGSTLVLTFTAPPDPKHIARQITTATFDLSLGGAMTKYDAEGILQKTSMPYHLEIIDLTWVRDPDGRIVPAMHHLTTFSKNGNDEHRIERTTTFESFKFEPVKPADVTYEALHVPDGTPIVDDIHHTEWKAGPKTP